MEKNICKDVTYFKKQNYGTIYLTKEEEEVTPRMRVCTKE